MERLHSLPNLPSRFLSRNLRRAGSRPYLFILDNTNKNDSGIVLLTSDSVKERRKWGTGSEGPQVPVHRLKIGHFTPTYVSVVQVQTGYFWKVHPKRYRSGETTKSRLLEPWGSPVHTFYRVGVLRSLVLETYS